jgi:hypothetical protein
MSSPTGHQRDTLEYQEALLSGLCKMASDHKQEMLSYLLGMAYMEVCDQLGRPIDALQRPATAEGISTHN